MTIGDKDYTIAEAIEMKNHGVPMLQKLLKKLDADNRQARRAADSSMQSINGYSPICAWTHKAV